jgi:hypothetical protein
MLFFEAMCAELSPNEFGMQASNLRAIKYLDQVGADRNRHQPEPFVIHMNYRTHSSYCETVSSARGLAFSAIECDAIID